LKLLTQPNDDMMTFKQFILEGSGHLTHVEDQVLYGGIEGAKSAIQALRAVRDSLTGKGATASVTVKWDGAPAIFCGTDPADGKFFVAKKSIFNKVPEVYKTPQDIDDHIEAGDLNNKMKVALIEFSKLGIRGIIQGDLLFTSDTLKRQKIQGRDYVTFHPNTIVYAVPLDSSEAKAIMAAKIGVVFHTSYTGKLSALHASPGVDTKSFKRIPSIWWRTADLKGIGTEKVSSTADLGKVDATLKEAEATLKSIPSSILKALQSNPDLAQTIETFANSKVRAGREIDDPQKHATELVAWMNARFDREVASKKTEKGKQAVNARRQITFDFFSRENLSNIVKAFKLQAQLVGAKKELIAQLNRLGGISTFLKTKDGYERTGQEGYVVGTKAGTVKLVDRLEFSKANFSPDVVKGWQR